jgi:hypothetical protein
MRKKPGVTTIIHKQNTIKKPEGKPPKTGTITAPAGR